MTSNITLLIAAIIIVVEVATTVVIAIPFTTNLTLSYIKITKAIKKSTNYDTKLKYISVYKIFYLLH